MNQQREQEALLAAQREKKLLAQTQAAQEKEEPPQNSDFCQLIGEMCGTKAYLIESALNSKLLSINLKSQRLDKEKQEVKNIVEQPTKRRTRIIESLHNFKIIHKKSSISLNNTSQISSVIENTPDLPTEEPNKSLSMRDEYFSTILETESNEVIKSSVENLVPIPSESEDVPMKNFKIYSNPLFNDEEVISTKIDPHYFNAESNLLESFLNRDTLIDSSPMFDYLLKEFSGELAYIDPIPSGIKEADFDLEEEIRYDSQMEEIDLFLAMDDLMPPGIKNDDYDSERDIHFLKELLSDDPLPLPKNESSNFDHHDDPSFPRPPPEPPDVEVFFDFEPDTGVLTSTVVKGISEHYVLMPNIFPTLLTLDLDLDFTPSHDSFGSGNKIFYTRIFIEVQSERLYHERNFLSHSSVILFIRYLTLYFRFHPRTRTKCSNLCHHHPVESFMVSLIRLDPNAITKVLTTSLCNPDGVTSISDVVSRTPTESSMGFFKSATLTSSQMVVTSSPSIIDGVKDDCDAVSTHCLFPGIPIDSSLTLSHHFFADDAIFVEETFLMEWTCQKKMAWICWNKVLASKNTVVLEFLVSMLLIELLSLNGFGDFSHCSCLWTRFLKAIYGEDGALNSQSSLSKHSPWLDIIREVTVLRTKGINLLDLIRKKVSNGLNTLFWEDPWLDDLALKHKFPRLYTLNNYKQITVVKKINHASMGDTFRRPPRGDAEEEQLDFLLSRMSCLILTNIPNLCVWSLEATSEFSVKSVRRLIDDLILSKEEVATRWVKVMPIKINVFAWRVRSDKLPTRLNLSLKVTNSRILTMQLVVPPWLEKLLSTEFFSVCRTHGDAARSERNMYCLDCNDEAFCFYCRSSRHKDHQVIQIRRSSYHDVVRVSEIEKVLNIDGVQTYVINSAKVLFLNERPQPKSSGKGGSRICEVCARSLLDTFRFCSLGCK
nr:hypothetical protein [Tanacetum cinerariifolium]